MLPVNQTTYNLQALPRLLPVTKEHIPISIRLLSQALNYAAARAVKATWQTLRKLFQLE